MAATRYFPLLEACERLPGIGRKTLMREIRARRLKAVQVGGRMTWFTSDAWLREFLELLQVEQAGKTAGRAGTRPAELGTAGCSVARSDAG